MTCVWITISLDGLINRYPGDSNHLSLYIHCEKDFAFQEIEAGHDISAVISVLLTQSKRKMVRCDRLILQGASVVRLQSDL